MVSDCEELQKKIDESLEDLFKKEQRFMGHLTIARVKKIEDKKEFLVGLNKISVPKVYFKIKKFYLMKSELGKKGPVYSIIEEYSL
jgi:2'-5' RNA ligase